MGLFRSLYRKLRFFYGLTYRAQSIYALLARMHRERILGEEQKAESKRITAFGWTAYSQGDEDGIINEIFRRIGAKSRTFVEIGCGDGTENNTVYLLLTGWSGYWIDGGEGEMTMIGSLFEPWLQQDKLRATRRFVTAENVNDVLAQIGVPEEIDLMSIDVDGNDYWIWEALSATSPRVIVIEYNATFRPPAKVVQEYNESFRWRFDNYFGASLKALEGLGTAKGYCLVGCGWTGLNAYFVRRDLAADCFSEPFSAENHYREPMYDAFVRGYSRHRKAIGKYLVLE